MFKKSIQILSIGAAVQDVFLHGEIFKAHRRGNSYFEEFPLGAKLELDNITFSTGGGATNASVTFARAGLHSSFMGQIGDDAAGQAVLDDLHRDGVDTHRIIYDDQNSTGYSVLLLAPNGERTILTYRGASTHFRPKLFNFEKLSADWIFLSSLSGNFELLQKILDFATRSNIKVAFNPGRGELKDIAKLREFLPKLTILSLNKDEIMQIYNGQSSEELCRQAVAEIPIVVVTDGPNGVVSASQIHNQVITAGMYEDVPVIDRTGAGDAFSSGFTAVIASGGSLIDAITYASANSTSVVGKIGAKAGILHGNSKLHSMPLDIQKL